MTVVWDAPESDGGSPITSYTVQRRDARRESYQDVAQPDAATLSAVAKKLIEGNSYYFRVTATNDVGESLPAETVDATVAKLPFDAPGAPTALEAVDVSAETATLNWAAPEFDGGSPVTGYYVERLSGKRWVKVNKKARMKTSLTLKDLITGDAYEYRVFAENEAGTGKPCEPIGFVAKNPYDVPGAPGQPQTTGVTADTASLSWTAPEGDGGAPISNYVVEMRRAGDAKWGVANKDGELTGTEYTVTGLTAGLEYEFRVTAVNVAGPGAASQPSQLTKYGKLRRSLILYSSILDRNWLYFLWILFL